MRDRSARQMTVLRAPRARSPGCSRRAPAPFTLAVDRGVPLGCAVPKVSFRR